MRGFTTSNDISAVATAVRETLKNTDIGKNEKVLDAMSKASAAVMVGFAKASGLTGKDYYDTIRGFMYGVESPVIGGVLNARFESIPHRESDRKLKSEEITQLIDISKRNAEIYIPIEYTEENWNSIFSGKRHVDTPIGRILIGEHQFVKLEDTNRTNFLGMVYPTLSNPSFILREPGGSDNGQDAFEFIKTFRSESEPRTLWFYSAVINKGESIGDVSISSRPSNPKQVRSRLKMYPLAYPTAVEWQAKNNVSDQGYAPSLNSNVSSSNNGVNGILESQAPDGSYRGWFNPDKLDRYISIMNNAEPTTLIHELAHHFLSVIKEDNPAYIMVRNVYSKQFEKDGGRIGENVQEAFFRDVLKYMKDEEG